MFLEFGFTELLLIGSVIGATVGYFSRNKARKNAALIGAGLGIGGAIVINYIFLNFVFASQLAVPVYSAFGGWFFNYFWPKSRKEEESVS